MWLILQLKTAILNKEWLQGKVLQVPLPPPPPPKKKKPQHFLQAANPLITYLLSIVWFF